MVNPCDEGHATPDTLQAERQRIAHALHGGIVQQITALSLAIDSALLHDGDGRHHEVSAALRTARELADLVVEDCRGLLDGLRGPAAGGRGLDGPGGARSRDA